MENRETVVQLISKTKTKTGLEIKAIIDKNEYQKGITISKEEMSLINEHKDVFHGEWNYQIMPNK